MKLPLLASANLQQPETLYHNFCLHFVVYTTLVTLGILYFFRPVDMRSIEARILVLFFPVCYSFFFTFLIFFKNREEIALSIPKSGHLWKILYSGICVFTFGFFFLDFIPETSFQIFIYKYFLMLLLIPYSLTSFLFFILCFFLKLTVSCPL